jgi:cobalt-precorrin 5A hydrolase
MKIRIIAFSTNGCRTSLKIKEGLDDDTEVWSKTRADTLGVPTIKGSLDRWTREAFEECDAIVFVGAIGIAVRHIAPYIKSKDVDPAIICLDELGKYCIPLLSGHIGGANRLSLRIADILGSEPVVTTATDINGKWAVDVFATDNRMRIIRLHEAKEASSRILHDEFIGFACDMPYEGKLPEGLTPADEGEFGICISSDGRKPFKKTLALVPMDIVLGIGCKRGTDPDKLRTFIGEILKEDGISPLRVRGIASIDLKKDEEALHVLAKELDTDLRFYTSDELMSLEGEFSKSEFVKSVTSVDCVCERSAVMLGKGELVRKKTAKDGMTVAISRNDITPRF